MYNAKSFLSALVLLLLVLAMQVGLESGARAQENNTGQSPLSYHKDVKPLLQAHCIGCHQPAKSSGDYDMTDLKQLFTGGQSGLAAITPKDPDNSYLLDLIEPIDGSAEMPVNKPPLSEEDRNTIRTWIEQGATIDASPSSQRVINSEHPPEYQSPPVITSLQASPDGKWVAVSGYHEVLLHRADGSGIEKRLVGLAERIEQVAFSPDGKFLAVAGGSPGRFGEVQVWDVATGMLTLSEMIGADTLYGVSWNQDGTKLAFGCPDTNIRAIDPSSGKQVLFNGAHDDWVLDTIFSTSGEYLISVGRDRSMKLVEVETQRFVDNITSITPGALKGGLNAVDRHPQKDELLAGGADGVPKVYQMLRTKARKIGDDFNLIRAYPALGGRINDTEFSPNGEHIAAVSSDDGNGHLKIFETENAKVIADINIKGCGLYALTFVPGTNHLCVAGFDGTIYIYDHSNGNLVNSFVSVPVTNGDKTKNQ